MWVENTFIQTDRSNVGQNRSDVEDQRGSETLRSSPGSTEHSGAAHLGILGHEFLAVARIDPVPQWRYWGPVCFQA